MLFYDTENIMTNNILVTHSTRNKINAQCTCQLQRYNYEIPVTGRSISTYTLIFPMSSVLFTVCYVPCTMSRRYVLCPFSRVIRPVFYVPYPMSRVLCPVPYAPCLMTHDPSEGSSVPEHVTNTRREERLSCRRDIVAITWTDELPGGVVWWCCQVVGRESIGGADRWLGTGGAARLGTDGAAMWWEDKV